MTATLRSVSSGGGELYISSVDQLLERASRYDLLTPEEELELAQRIERGDLDAKDLLVNSNLRLVVSVVRHYIGQGLTLEDLVQEGMLGLIRAVEKFDYRKGYRFSTYACIWIRQAVQRGIDNTGRTIRVPTHMEHRIRRIKKAIRRLESELGRRPTPEEITAAVVGLDLAEVKFLLLRDEELASLDQEVGEYEDTSLGALLPSGEPLVEDSVVDGLWSQELQGAVGRLPEQERAVVRLRFALTGEGELTRKEVAYRLRLKESQVREIEERALRRLAIDGDVKALRQAA